VLFPLKQTGRHQPLLVTGRTGAGTNVFVSYFNETHVRIGADIWGTQYLSDPIAVDYFQTQDIVVNSSALYPLDHPKVRALDPRLREQLRNDFRVELNGELVLSRHRSAYESTVGEVTVGETRIGGSLTQTKFTGEVFSVKRLPPPPALVLTRGQNLRLSARFPKGRVGITETLFSFGTGNDAGSCSVTYEVGGTTASRPTRTGRRGHRCG